MRAWRIRGHVRNLLRAGAIAVIGAVFVWLAVEFDPVQSSAQFRANDRTKGEEPVRGKLLGSLIGASYTIRVHTSPQGAVYSVWDTRNGRLLAESLPADDVYRLFPDIDVRSMQLAPESGPEQAELFGPLMSADEHRPEIP